MRFLSPRIASVLALALLMAPVSDADRLNYQFTITAGTGIRPFPNPNVTPTFASRLFIQSRHSNTGLILISLGVPYGTACDATQAAQLTAELGPGSSTQPGQSFSDPQGANGNTIPDAEDIGKICIDGSHTGDVAILSFWRRN